MIARLIYEICCCCNRPVRAGHPFMTCQMCDKIMHKKCKTDDNIVKFRDATYCKICTDANDIVRYNPFYQAPHFANNGLIDDEPVNYIKSIYNSSKILENCKTFSITELNGTILPKNSAKYLSRLFLNIDGNASTLTTLQLSCLVSTTNSLLSVLQKQILIPKMEPCISLTNTPPVTNHVIFVKRKTSSRVKDQECVFTCTTPLTLTKSLAYLSVMNT